MMKDTETRTMHTSSAEPSPAVTNAENAQEFSTPADKDSVNSTDTSASNSDHANADQKPDIDASTRYLAMAELSGAWLKNLGALALLELQRSLEATKRSMVLQAILIPMYVIFYLSLCSALGYATYIETASVYAGLACFVTLQALVIFFIHRRRTFLKSQIGFAYTTAQIREAKDDILSALK